MTLYDIANGIMYLLCFATGWCWGFRTGYRHMAKIALKEVKEFGRSIGLEKK